jgi:hypothetical protein
MFDPKPHYASHPAKRTWVNPKNGAIHVVTGIGRINYPALAEPRAQKGPNGQAKPAKYGAMILLAQMQHNTEIMKAIGELAAKTFGPDWVEKNKIVSDGKRVKIPVKSQAELAADYPGKGKADMAQYDEGGAYLRASSQYQPSVTGPSNLPLDAAAIAAIKSGDYVRFEIALLPYLPKPDAPNQGITAYLQSVQFLAPGLPFVAARQTNFDAIEIPAFGAPQGASAGGYDWAA